MSEAQDWFCYLLECARLRLSILYCTFYAPFDWREAHLPAPLMLAEA